MATTWEWLRSHALALPDLAKFPDRPRWRRSWRGSAPTGWSRTSLTLPQVAATLAASLVGYDTRNATGGRLVDHNVLDTVFVLILTTATLGPILTERFAPRMLKSVGGSERKKAA